MALNVNIAWPSGTIEGCTTGYYLKAESASHSIIRFATQAPLPTTPGEDTNIFTLDLGMSREEITIQGVVDSTGSTALGYPSKNNLEDVGRLWWNFGADNASALPLLTLEAGQAYYGSVKSVDFRWEGALEDRWQFTLTFLVNKKQ